MRNREFEICARAIIQHRGKILICWNKEKGYYFFPGGHMNFGEEVETTLTRELKEELNISVKRCSFIGWVENVFVEETQKHHEINLVFGVKVDKIKERSRENHIGFRLIDKNKFSGVEILPIALKKAILKWLKDKKIFWASQIYDKISVK